VHKRADTPASDAEKCPRSQVTALEDVEELTGTERANVAVARGPAAGRRGRRRRECVGVGRGPGPDFRASRASPECALPRCPTHTQPLTDNWSKRRCTGTRCSTRTHRVRPSSSIRSVGPVRRCATSPARSCAPRATRPRTRRAQRASRAGVVRPRTWAARCATRARTARAARARAATTTRALGRPATTATTPAVHARQCPRPRHSSRRAPPCYARACTAQPAARVDAARARRSGRGRRRGRWRGARAGARTVRRDHRRARGVPRDVAGTVGESCVLYCNSIAAIKLYSNHHRGASGDLTWTKRRLCIRRKLWPLLWEVVGVVRAAASATA
jgi:hypothetical protein